MDLFWEVALVLFGYFFLFFIVGQLLENNSIVDIGWGLGFVVATIYMITRIEIEIYSLIVLAIIILWGLRLTYHIFRRNYGKPEDFRYQNFRKRWGKRFPRLKAFFHVYMLQMLFMYALLIPVILFMSSSRKYSPFIIVGIVIWLLGYFFEVVGDAQLKKYLNNRTEKGIMNTGLWKVTRHPNYFGEVTMWWGIFIITISVQYGYIGIVSPILITYLLLKVSGVPMLEKKYKDDPEYQKYMEVTPRFVPWIGKKG